MDQTYLLGWAVGGMMCVYVSIIRIKAIVHSNLDKVNTTYYYDMNLSKVHLAFTLRTCFQTSIHILFPLVPMTRVRLTFCPPTLPSWCTEKLARCGPEAIARHHGPHHREPEPPSSTTATRTNIMQMFESQ